VAKRAYVGLGSNLGDRLGNLQRAVELLMPASFPIRLSGVFESEPWGFDSENLFLNAVAEIETDIEPRELLGELHKVEYLLGREREHVRTEKNYHDRVIDLDLLWYEDFEFKSGTFEVPHALACIRAFVLKPWSELDDTIRLRGVQIKHWLESLPPEELEHTLPRKELKLSLPALNDLLGGLQVP
jgi:2-amino-4-hydroxy-6-hydroxymethyldihydropteridine diphosphokinase